MKVGINARFLVHPYTGIGQYTRYLIPEIAKLAPEDEFLLFTPEMADLQLPENCRQIRVVEKDTPSPSLQKAHWEQVLLPAEFERHGVNLVHYLYPSNPRKKLPIPTIVTVHDVIPWKLKSYRTKFRSKLYHFNAKLALKKADHILTVSNFSKKEIESVLKLKNKHVTVTHLAPPKAEAKIQFPNLDLRRQFLLYVGGYDARKNVPRLLEAYQKHIAPYYAIDLILVGGRNKGLEHLITDRYMERIAGQFPVKPKGNVIFIGSLPQSELLCLYRQSLGLVHASMYEGFNLALVEAMASEKPLVVSDLPVHREVAGSSALYVDPLSVDSIGLGMHQLIHDSKLQVELSDNSKRQIQNFSWKKAAEETLYVYHLYA